MGSTGNEGRHVTVMTVAPIRVLCKAEAVAHCLAGFRGMLGGVSRSSVEWRLVLGARQQWAALGSLWFGEEGSVRQGWLERLKGSE